jgi:hypothetical protein
LTNAISDLLQVHLAEYSDDLAGSLARNGELALSFAVKATVEEMGIFVDCKCNFVTSRVKATLHHLIPNQDSLPGIATPARSGPEPVGG